jgi:hypothetical protein
VKVLRSIMYTLLLVVLGLPLGTAWAISQATWETIVTVYLLILEVWGHEPPPEEWPGAPPPEPY